MDDLPWMTFLQPSSAGVTHSSACRARPAACAQAYADYHDLMAMTEQMVSQMVVKLRGSYQLAYHTDGPDAPPVQIDFTPPWRRISMARSRAHTLPTRVPVDRPLACLAPSSERGAPNAALVTECVSLTAPGVLASHGVSSCMAM